MNGTTRLLVCSLAVAWAAAPAAARAQSADPERPSVRIGPVELKPRLSFTNVGIDYNVFSMSGSFT